MALGALKTKLRWRWQGVFLKVVQKTEMVAGWGGSWGGLVGGGEGGGGGGGGWGGAWGWGRGVGMGCDRGGWGGRGRGGMRFFVVSRGGSFAKEPRGAQEDTFN